MKRSRVAASLLAFVAVAASPPLVLAPPASADHANVFSHVNSRYWNVCVQIDGAPAAVDAAIARIDATNVNAQRSCVNQKVTVYAQNYPDGWYGYAPCGDSPQPPGGAGCTRYIVYLNTRVAVSAQQRRKSATHEFGHAAGMGHRADNASVMTQGESPPVSEFYNQHDVNVINAQYP